MPSDFVRLSIHLLTQGVSQASRDHTYLSKWDQILALLINSSSSGMRFFGQKHLTRLFSCPQGGRATRSIVAYQSLLSILLAISLHLTMGKKRKKKSQSAEMEYACSMVPGATFVVLGRSLPEEILGKGECDIWRLLHRRAMHR